MSTCVERRDVLTCIVSRSSIFFWTIARSLSLFLSVFLALDARSAKFLSIPRNAFFKSSYFELSTSKDSASALPMRTDCMSALSKSRSFELAPMFCARFSFWAIPCPFVFLPIVWTASERRLSFSDIVLTSSSRRPSVSFVCMLSRRSIISRSSTSRIFDWISSM